MYQLCVYLFAAWLQEMSISITGGAGRGAITPAGLGVGVPGRRAWSRSGSIFQGGSGKSGGLS